LISIFKTIIQYTFFKNVNIKHLKEIHIVFFT